MGCTPSCPKLHQLHDRTAANRSSSSGGSDAQALVQLRCNDDGPVDSTLMVKGPRGLKLKKERMTVLLLFPKKDSQLTTLITAARRCQLTVDVAFTSEQALSLFSRTEHDLVIVDRRSPAFAPSADHTCRSIRASSPGARECTVIVAVVPAHRHGDEDVWMMKLLEKGYNKRVLESTNVRVWADELLMTEANEVAASNRLRALEAALAALDSVHELVEISNGSNEVEYINGAYRSYFGYTLDEAIGQEMYRWDRATEDKKEHILETTKCGDPWRGHLMSTKRNGSIVPHQTTIVPVMGSCGRVRHLVSVKRPLTCDGLPSASKEGPPILQRSRSVHNQRRDSLGKKAQALAFDTPIAKVIHLIYAAIENSTPQVAQSLERALDILQTSDLYAAAVNTSQDKMTSDLIEGLMTNAKMLNDRTERRRLSSGVSSAKRGSRNSEVLREHIRQVLETHNSLTSSNQTFPIPPDVQSHLRDNDAWTYDILELERVTAKKPLVYLGYTIFHRFRAFEVLNCSMDVLQNWLNVMQRNYHVENPYHNATHAADVMQSAAYFLEKEAIQEHLSRLDEIACLVGAIIHDLDHPGRTNIFLINGGHKLAILYNDISVLEAHHVSLAFQLTQKDERIDIFRSMKSREDFQVLRQAIIDIVLATEMAKHGEHLFKFECLAKFLGSRCDLSDRERENQLQKMEYPAVIRRMLIKCSDVNNPCRPLKVCKEWAQRIAEEYFTQTDDERSKGLPVSMPHFDRKTKNIPASQVSFIDLFIREMYGIWSEFCNAPECMKVMEKNYRYWLRRKLKGRTDGGTDDDDEEDEEADDDIEEEPVADLVNDINEVEHQVEHDDDEEEEEKMLEIHAAPV